MLLTTCTSYCPRRAVEQRGFWFHAQTDLITCPDFSRAFGNGSAPTQRGGGHRNPLAWQIISKLYSFSPELSLHP